MGVQVTRHSSRINISHIIIIHVDNQFHRSIGSLASQPEGETTQIHCLASALFHASGLSHHDSNLHATPLLKGYGLTTSSPRTVMLRLTKYDKDIE